MDEKVGIAGSMRAFQIPLGSILCLIILLPVAWQIRKRKQSGKPFVTQVGQMLLLIVASMLLYPYLNVSVARLGFGASRMTNDEGQVILRSLLKNVYRAFDFRDEGDVYDKLAISASGDLLGELY